MRITSLLLIIVGAACATSPSSIERRSDAPQTIAGVTSQDAAPVAPGITPQPDTRPAALGWLKTIEYEPDSAIAPTAPGVVFSLPRVHETVLEGHVRRSLLDELRAQNINVVEEGASADLDEALVITYSAEVFNEHRGKRPPQSPLRFAPPLSDPRRDDRFPLRPPLPIGEFDPGFIYYDPEINRQPSDRAVKVTMFLHRGSERLWAGYANAEMPYNGRRAVADALTRALVRQVGATTDAPNAAFFIETAGR